MVNPILERKHAMSQGSKIPTRFTWLFDLDNTLHNASPHIFPHINRSMTAYMAEHLKLSLEDAGALRATYWRRYGATLHGLMRHHNTDPMHFLWQTHQFPNLARMIVSETGLRHALRRLHGRKIIFSNAPAHYAEAVLKLLNIADLFDAVYTVDRVRFQPKPEAGGFRHILQREGLQARRCVLVEDSLPNLRVAKLLGMKTVWVTRESRHPAIVDSKIASVLKLPAVAAKIGVRR
jgi:putative hydrolase of the HAD superfamily